MASHSTSPGLEALFATDRFLTENWPNQPRVFHHDLARAPEIWHLPELQTLDDALPFATPETVFANLPDHNEEYNEIQLVRYQASDS